MVDVETGIYGECRVESVIKNVTSSFRIVVKVSIGLYAWRWEGEIFVPVFGIPAGLVESSNLSYEAVIETEDLVVF
jgi:hypothetical protein